MQTYESTEQNGRAHNDGVIARDAIRCGVCSQNLSERHFRKLYLSEIPGYPLGAPLRTLARLLICKKCWNAARDSNSRTEIRLRKLIQWTRG